MKTRRNWVRFILEHPVDVSLSIAGVMLVMKRSQTGNTVSYHVNVSRSAYSQINGSGWGLKKRAYLNLVEGGLFLHSGKSYKVIDRSLIKVLETELEEVN